MDNRRLSQRFELFEGAVVFFLRIGNGTIPGSVVLNRSPLRRSPPSKRLDRKAIILWCLASRHLPLTPGPMGQRKLSGGPPVGINKDYHLLAPLWIMGAALDWGTVKRHEHVGVYRNPFSAPNGLAGGFRSSDIGGPKSCLN